MFINGWSEITLDPDYNLKSNFLGNNRENMKNENLFIGIKNAKTIVDDDQRLSAYYKIQESIMDINSRIPIYHAKDVWVCNKNIEFRARHDRLIDLKDIKFA
jgi:ABC-type transport system substrate-binding protein